MKGNHPKNKMQKGVFSRSFSAIFYSFILVSSLTFLFAAPVNADGGFSITSLTWTGIPGGVCNHVADITGGQITYSIGVDNNTSQHYRIDHLSFHSNTSGCTPTTENGGSAFVKTSGTDDYPAFTSGNLGLKYNVNSYNCGRTQIDAGYSNDDGSDHAVFVGEVIDYGVDCPANPPANNPPVITLLGSNPATTTVGTTYTDAGATAFDQEDGDITSKIVASSTVNTSVAGTYSVTYNVSDSQGLAATPVTREVDVLPVVVIPIPTVTLTANPTDAPFEGTTTLSWFSTNSSSCTASLDWSGSKATSGTEIQNNLTSNKTFKITCTGPGGVASSTASVTVASAPTTNQCALPDTLGDNTLGVISASASPEPSISDIEASYGLVVSNQNSDQIWHATESTTTVKIKFLNGYTAAGDVFGYYKKGDPNSFVPLFRNAYPNALYNSIQVAVPGQTYDITLPAGDYGFAIHEEFYSVTNLWASEISLNSDGHDHVLTFDVLNHDTGVASYVLGFEDLPSTGTDDDYNDLVVEVSVESCEQAIPVNHPPVITLIGANPATVNVGDTYTDAGATAFDQEDGDITSKIVASSTVNTSVAGTYSVTYNVSDSQGLAATPVTREVDVVPVTPTQKGKLTVCMIIADNQNNIATSSAGLPAGTFTINLATTTDFASSTFQTKTWNTTSFAPNTSNILSTHDSDCVTYSNLDLGTYYYSQLNVTGSLWNIPKYSDQFNQPVNSVFDLFPYSPELFNATTTDDDSRNFNSDGQISLTPDNTERMVIVFDTYNPVPECLLPSITSALTAQGIVGQSFSYTITATSTNSITVATSTLPDWMSFATSTDTLSGTPTQVGTYNITLKAQNICAIDTETLVLTIAAASGGGGGGSSGANLGIVKTADKSTANAGDTVTYTITVTNNGPDNATNVDIKDILPNTMSFISATSSIGLYSTTTGEWLVGDLANSSSTSLTLVATINSGTAGQKITNTATVTASQNDSDTSNNSSSADVNVNNPAPPACSSNCGGGGGGGGGTPPPGNGPPVGSFGGGGGNGPIVPQPQVEGASTSSCYYLRDYLRKDFNNDPLEVKKLQIFLRNFEGDTNLAVTGVYDDSTIYYVDQFQIKYKDDVLLPWGYDGTTGTDYVYILTKKKVNEIYCQMPFPVNAAQQAEIDAHKALWDELRANGISIPSSNFFPSSGVEGTSTEQVPVLLTPGSPARTNSTSSTSSLSTLAGLSSTTQKITSDLTANVLSAGKKVLGALWALLSWPFVKVNQCTPNTLAFWWIILLLLAVIGAMAYLWRKQYQDNKNLEKINKEIDLK